MNYETVFISGLLILVVYAFVAFMFLVVFNISIVSLTIDYFKYVTNVFYSPFKYLKQKGMINTRALTKALQFLCLPTLSILLVLYFWFFNWTDFVGFVTSKSGSAGFLRVLLMIGEIVLVGNMYLYYDKRLPDATKGKKLKEGVLGEGSRVVGTSPLYKADNEINAYHNQDMSRLIDMHLKPLNQKYVVDAIRVDGVDDALILKTRLI